MRKQPIAKIITNQLRGFQPTDCEAFDQPIAKQLCYGVIVDIDPSAFFAYACEKKHQAIRFSNAIQSLGTNTTIFSCYLYIITTKFWQHFGIFTTLAKGLSASQQLRKLHKRA